MAELNAKSVSFRFSEEFGLEDVSLTAKPGEILALIGPNGAGKTTFIRLICRVLRPQSGEVFLGEKDVWSFHSREFARKVARVCQSNKLAWPYTVKQIVHMGRYPHRGWIASYTLEDQEKIDEAIHATGLWNHRERIINTLSGGEAQRAMVARALAQSPEVMVLDEPVAHLDMKYKIAILDLLKKLARGGMAVVVSLHDLNLASLYAHRIALIADGRLKCLGTPEEILTRENLKEAYETEVIINAHPEFGKPVVTPVPAGM